MHVDLSDARTRKEWDAEFAEDVALLRRLQGTPMIVVSSTSLIADAAIRFCELDRQLTEATGPGRGEVAIACLAARHDLQLLCGVPCGCDPGTCEGIIGA